VPLEQSRLFVDIVMKLSILRYMVKSLCKRGRTDLSRACEPFFRDLLNLIFGYELENANDEKLNAAAIDLRDRNNRLCFQITARTDRRKIQDTINLFRKRNLDKEFSELRFLLLSEKKISSKPFSTWGDFNFSFDRHVLDVDDVIAATEALPLQKLKAVHAFIESQLAAITHSLEPDSLLDTFEKVASKAAENAGKILHDSDYKEGQLQSELDGINKLCRKLSELSQKQREFLSFFLPSADGMRSTSSLICPLQTLQQKTLLDENEFREYLQVLGETGLIDVDTDEKPYKVRLQFTLPVSGVDLFELVVEELKPPEISELILRCNFSVLDIGNDVDRP
jgi:hypothetical protein